MTDLPYGRGGSPLQNLIIRGHKDTMITAIRCMKGLDAGPIYIKKPLSLEGSAKEIFERANKTIEKMIISIVETNIKPKPQVGKVTKFERRKPAQSNWSKAKSLDEVYNYIRMLDAEGYPPAFIDTENFKLEFSSATKSSNSISAKVIIKKLNKK